MERRPAALDAWAELAPLSEKQRLSVSHVATYKSGNKPDVSVPALPQAATVSTQFSLLKWLSAVKLKDTSHETKLAALQSEIDALNLLLLQADAVLELARLLEDGIDFVISHSNEILSQAAQLADGQAQLEGLYIQIVDRLENFAVLPQVTNILAAMTPQSMEIDNMVKVIQSVKRALSFMQENPDYLDAKVYQLRLENCLERASDLVRINFSFVGNALADSAQGRIRELEQLRDFGTHDGKLEPDAPPLVQILYGEFTLSSFHPLFAELETSGQASCKAALSECQTMWCSWRISLFQHILKTRFDAMRKEESCIDIAKEGANLLARVSICESQLYGSLFSFVPEQQRPLEVFLQQLGQDLLGVLSPRLHVPISTLAEVYTIIQMHSTNSGKWTTPSLKYVSSRLLDAADASLRHEVAAYRPNAAQISETMQHDKPHNERSLLGMELTKGHTVLFSSPEELVKTWYTPVQHTYTLLAALYNRTPMDSFLVFAAKAIDTCVTSVIAGASTLREAGPSGVADASAFSLRYLFLLKELYLTVDVASKQEHGPLTPSDLGVRYVSVSVVLEAMQSIWKQRPTDAHELLAPVLSRIDGAINTASEQLSEYLGASIALPLRVFVAQKARGAEPDMDAAWKTFQQSLEVNLSDAQERLAGSICDEQTAARLTEATLTRVLQTYDEFRSAVGDTSALPEPVHLQQQLAACMQSIAL